MHLMHWVAWAGVLWLAPAALACPLCKDGVAVDARPTADVATAAAAVDFNPSIYVMLGTVAVVATAAGRAMVKAVRG